MQEQGENPKVEDPEEGYGSLGTSVLGDFTGNWVEFNKRTKLLEPVIAQVEIESDEKATT